MEQKIMKALARKTEDAFENEYEELNEAGKEFSPQLDAKLLEAARFYDKRYAAGQKKRKSLLSVMSAKLFSVRSRNCNAVLVFACLSPVCVSGV